MSDTPRTDAVKFAVEVTGPGGAGKETEFRVDAEEMEKLERELTAANQRIAELKRIMRSMRHLCQYRYDQDQLHLCKILMNDIDAAMRKESNDA